MLKDRKNLVCLLILPAGMRKRTSAPVEPAEPSANPGAPIGNTYVSPETHQPSTVDGFLVSNRTCASPAAQDFAIVTLYPRHNYVLFIALIFMNR